MQSVPITTKVVSLNLPHGEVYSIHMYHTNTTTEAPVILDFDRSLSTIEVKIQNGLSIMNLYFTNMISFCNQITDIFIKFKSNHQNNITK
jgi:hypothetical protein